MIRIEIDDTELRTALSRLIERAADTTPAMQDIGELMIERTRERFRAGRAPDGTPWAPLSPVTLARKRDPRPLIGESGRLSSEFAYRAGRGEVEIGTNLVYAAVQQFGASQGEFGHPHRRRSVRHQLEASVEAASRARCGSAPPGQAGRRKMRPRRIGLAEAAWRAPLTATRVTRPRWVNVPTNLQVSGAPSASAGRLCRRFFRHHPTSAQLRRKARRLGGDPGKALPDGWDERDRRGRLRGIDEGWDYAPGASQGAPSPWQAKAAALPTALSAALQAHMAEVRDTVAVRAVNQDILARARKDPLPIVEYAALIQDGQVLWVQRGGDRHVSFSGEQLGQMRGGVLTHNHPSSMSLSLADLNLAATTGLRRLSAVGADGSIYWARPVVDVHRLTTLRDAADRFVFEALSERIRTGQITTTQADRYHWHIVNLRLARQGAIRYHAIVFGGTPPWGYAVAREGLP